MRRRGPSPRNPPVVVGGASSVASGGRGEGCISGQVRALLPPSSEGRDSPLESVHWYGFRPGVGGPGSGRPGAGEPAANTSRSPAASRVRTAWSSGSALRSPATIAGRAGSSQAARAAALRWRAAEGRPSRWQSAKTKRRPLARSVKSASVTIRGRRLPQPVEPGWSGESENQRVVEPSRARRAWRYSTVQRSPRRRPSLRPAPVAA